MEVRRSRQSPFGKAGTIISIVTVLLFIVTIIMAIYGSQLRVINAQEEYESARALAAHDVRLFGYVIGRGLVTGRETSQVAENLIDRSTVYWLSFISEESGSELMMEVSQAQYEAITDDALLVFYKGFGVDSSIAHRSWFMDVHLLEGGSFRGYYWDELLDLSDITEDSDDYYLHYVPVVRDVFLIGRYYEDLEATPVPPTQTYYEDYWWIH